MRAAAIARSSFANSSSCSSHGGFVKLPARDGLFLERRHGPHHVALRMLQDRGDTPMRRKLCSEPEGAVHFGYVNRGACVLLDRRCGHVSEMVFPLTAGMFFCTPGPFELHAKSTASGSEAIIISQTGAQGSFLLGGPAEAEYLQYIDGCKDSLLLPPVLCGEPCLNMLFLPANTEQTPHTHQSLRLGMVVSGAGHCLAWPSEDGGARGKFKGDGFTADEALVTPLSTGDVFSIMPETPHCFVTSGDKSGLRVLAFHPDSDFGPTNEKHPMVNRTVIGGGWQAGVASQ